MKSISNEKGRALIGRRIRLQREVKGYNQDVMALELGISQKAYSKIESEETNLSVERVMEIIKILGIDLTDLLCSDVVAIDKISKNQSVNFAQRDLTNHNNGLSDKEREQYEKRIIHLEEEIVFLRKLLDR